MGSKNQTTTSTQSLPGYINDAYKQLVAGAQQTGQTPYTPYTGGFTADQQQAFQNIRDMWGTGNQAFDAASGAYGTSMVPTHQTVDQYMSPYMTSVVDAAMANMQEQNAQQQQGVVGNAIAKGAMGGNRVGVAQAELGRQQKLADNAAIANLLQSGYGTALGAAQADKTAALQAGQGLAGLGQTQMQTGLAQTASQLGAGTQQQQFDYQQYLNQLAFPYQQQSWLASIIGGLGSTAGGTTQQTTPQGNIFSQLLGTGLSIAGLFSDERVKEGARPVGKTFDGQTIYSYRYKGQPQTHMGLMAQEVSKDHPEAVGQRGGVLTVDYDRATRDAARKGEFAMGGVVPLDVDLARRPVRIMRENPFGMGFDYDASPRLNQPIRRGDWLDMFRERERTNLDEMWEPMNAIEREYVRDLRDRPGMAMGGVPYVNDNGAFPAYMSMSAAPPYSNDNEDGNFGGYIPKAVSIGGGNRIPEAAKMPEQEDPFADPSGMMKKGAGNITSWLSPSIAGGADIPDYGFIPGITGPKLFSRGGVTRKHAASGGVMSPDEVEALYGGILLPGTGGLVGGAPIPPRPLPDVPVIDAATPLDGDRLGLNVDTTPERTLPPRGEDPYLGIGGGEPSYEPIPQRPLRKVAGGNRPGEVIYGEGERFRTRFPDEGYSKNGMEAMQSLFSGKGLNLAPDAQNALLQAGFGMMASRSPFFLQGVGEGGLAGMKAWQEYQAMERENATARAAIGQKGEELAQQAELLGAQIPGMEATTASTDVGTLTQRWSFERTPGGMMVTDKTTNSPPIFYPWGGVLPDGTIVDSRLMSPETAGIAIGETTRALEMAAPAASAAQSSNMQLAEVEHDLTTLPAAGLLTPGSDFGTRLEWAKGINTAFRMVGADPPISEKEVAAGEDLGKLTTRMGGELARAMGGSDTAASIVMTAIGAVPNGALSPDGNTKIINALRMGNQRKIDYYNFLQAYSADNNGSLLGAEAAFNQQNPPESYAYAAVIPRDAVGDLLRDPSPEAIAEFNEIFGHGTDVAKHYLRR